MGWKPEIQVVSEPGKWSRNSLIFATKEEAEASAKELFSRWYACIDHRAAEVDAEPTHVFVDGQNKPIAKVAP